MISNRIPEFKIRCSQIGKIMGGALTQPTAKQLARISELQEKELVYLNNSFLPTPDKKVKPLTDNQKAELADLVAKRDSKPDLQQGAKTFCENWLKEHLYHRKQEISSKYMEKGIDCEQDAIDFVAKVMGYGFVLKNTDRKANDWMEGECDMLLPAIVEDTKCSWSCFTFPLFATELPESDYMFQLQGYMDLYDRNKAAVNYCLMDAPEHLIDAEARIAARKAGLSEVDMELYDEIKDKMTYSNLPDKLRLKRFEFDRDDTIIAAIRKQVELCRDYIATITPQYIELLEQPITAAA